MPQKRKFHAVFDEDETSAQALRDTATTVIVSCAWYAHWTPPHRHIDRHPNEHRNRDYVDQKIINLKASPLIFRRMFRLSVDDFHSVLNKIGRRLQTNHEMARRSSGTPIYPDIMLSVTLRMLAGGSYLDIAFGFDIAVCSVFHAFDLVLDAILSEPSLDNIVFPLLDYEKLAEMAAGFDRFTGHFSDGSPVFGGTVGATDGIIFRKKKPSNELANSIDTRTRRSRITASLSNRKQYRRGRNANPSARIERIKDSITHIILQV